MVDTVSIPEKPYSNIQNGENWCWVTAAKLVAHHYSHKNKNEPYKIDKSARSENVRRIDVQSGFRSLYLGVDGESYTADDLQCRIMEKASGNEVNGKYSGNDECKCKALEYVLGNEGTTDLRAVTIGHYASKLIDDFEDELRTILKSNSAFIGNYCFIHQPDLIHSVVCIPRNENQIYLYDPWDGYDAKFTLLQMFRTGFLTNRGAGIITWLQYLK